MQVVHGESRLSARARKPVTSGGSTTREGRPPQAPLTTRRAFAALRHNGKLGTPEIGARSPPGMQAGTLRTHARTRPHNVSTHARAHPEHRPATAQRLARTDPARFARKSTTLAAGIKPRSPSHTAANAPHTPLHPARKLSLLKRSTENRESIGHRGPPQAAHGHTRSQHTDAPRDHTRTMPLARRQASSSLQHGAAIAHARAA
jgi:hypothetical protein